MSISNQPISIYQVDPGSWMRVPEQNNRPLTCAEIAPKLADYSRRMNFTHLEFLSLASFAIEGEREIGRLMDYLHQHGLGVILAGQTGEVAGKLHADGWREGDKVFLFDGDQLAELKWDAHWRQETIGYLNQEPGQRKFHHQQIIGCAGQADHLILPLTYDLVAPGKSSLFQQMPGDAWQKFANLRLLFALMIAHPGKKSLFMGGEFGQNNCWRPETSLDWHLVEEVNFHGKLQRWVSELNHFYLKESALHQTDANPAGFEWVNASDADWSTASWLRKNPATGETILVVFNFTPTPRHNYRVGAPTGGFWREMLNSDAHEYGGSGQGNLGGVEAAPFGWDYESHSLTITLPPLGALFFKHTN